MKQLFLDPLIISLLVGVSLIYAILGFHYVNQNKRLSENFEKIYIGLFIMTLSGITIGLFGKFHPEALYLHGKTLPSYVLQLGVYGACFAFTGSRLRYNLKDLVFVFSNLIKRSLSSCIFVLLVFLSFLWSETPGYSLKAGIVFLGVTLFFIYVGKQFKLEQLFELLLWTNTILLLLSVFYSVFRPSEGTSLGGAWNGVFGHKNEAGFMLSLTSILIYIQSLRRPQHRFQFLALAALSVFATYKANSGMGKVLIIILIAQLIFIYFVRQMKPRLAFAAMIFFLAIGICLTILIIENAEYIIVEKLGKDMTLTGRTKFWPLIVDAINKRPLLGYGYEGFWQPWRGADNPGNAIRAASLGDFIPGHSHNGFLDLALIVGWLGLSIFIISLLSNIYKAVVCLSRNKAPESVLPIILLTWIVMTNITEIGIVNIEKQWAFYVLVTVRLSLDTIEENVRATRPQEPRLISRSNR